ncbi:MFS transporter [Megamonas hypermegale]|uniref:MFS transporter n=1 Tax=Megamonas hypermegale TaxID=158847 RepID=UPI00195812D6|nr:MFS transporter [Megamonas hypermegale]MBM6762109.1 MFS transporter [Megamonas hypermegale]
MTGEKSFTLPVFALILLSFILGTSEFVIIGILPDIAAGIDCSIVMIGNGSRYAICRLWRSSIYAHSFVR